MKKQKENFAYESLGQRIRTEWKIYLLAFLFCSDRRQYRSDQNSSGNRDVYFIPNLLCHYSGRGKRSSGTEDRRKETILSAGPAVLLHGFGNFFGIFLALPVAILLGMKREAVGACFSINREYHMALINNIYGADSAEARGSLSIYIVGGMVGTIYFGILASAVAMTGLFHPEAIGLASGVGAGIMMASSSASLCAMYPDFAESIKTLASVGETMAGITGIYINMFIAIPLCDKLYQILEPKLGHFGRKKKAGKE